MRWASTRAASTYLHVVHRIQRLQRRVRHVLPDNAALAACRIEVGHRGGRHRALPEGIEAAAVQVLAASLPIIFVRIQLAPETRRLIRIDRRASDLVDEQTGDGERLIANHVRREAHVRTAREESILRVALQHLWSDARRLTVRGAEHDGLLHRLHVPPRADELSGQPVEQLRMRGRLALRAEVLHGLDETGAEIHLPEPVGGDACRQRV